MEWLKFESLLFCREGYFFVFVWLIVYYLGKVREVRIILKFCEGYVVVW